MRKNRKRTKRMSVVASHTMHVFGVIVVFFAMVILNMLAHSSCAQLQKANGEKERVLRSLEKDRERESARWDGMHTLERLESALVRHGMDMKYPKSVQIIMMDESGRPLVAQNSVKEALRRKGVVAAAEYKAVVPSVRTTVAPARVRSTRRARR